MAQVQKINLKDALWHKLRADLVRLAPNLASDDKLICCCCGRLLSFENFSLEHIIPRQALLDDPSAAKDAIASQQRSGVTLLCNSPLNVNRKPVTSHGCNGWKGKHYDTTLRTIFNGSAFTTRTTTSNRVVVAATSAAFLAFFLEFGYQVALSSAGLYLRRQFFSPDNFLPDTDGRSQMLLVGRMPTFDPATPHTWGTPFSFDFQRPGLCLVGIRNYVVTLPISRDPRIPIASSLSFVPAKYKLRPDFRAFFD